MSIEIKTQRLIEVYTTPNIRCCYFKMLLDTSMCFFSSFISNQLLFSAFSCIFLIILLHMCICLCALFVVFTCKSVCVCMCVQTRFQCIQCICTLYVYLLNMCDFYCCCYCCLFIIVASILCSAFNEQ